MSHSPSFNRDTRSFEGDRSGFSNPGRMERLLGPEGFRRWKAYRNWLDSIPGVRGESKEAVVQALMTRDNIGPDEARRLIDFMQAGGAGGAGGPGSKPSQPGQPIRAFPSLPPPSPIPPGKENTIFNRSGATTNPINPNTNPGVFPGPGGVSGPGGDSTGPSFTDDLISEIFGQRPELALFGNIAKSGLRPNEQKFLSTGSRASGFLERLQESVGSQLVGGGLPTVTPQNFFGNLNFQEELFKFSPRTRGVGKGALAPQTRFLR